jgi:hypothetical protein
MNLWIETPFSPQFKKSILKYWIHRSLEGLFAKFIKMLNWKENGIPPRSENLKCK